MRLTVAANYDPDIVPQSQQYPVTEVYGKFPVDFVGAQDVRLDTEHPGCGPVDNDVPIMRHSRVGR